MKVPGRGDSVKSARMLLDVLEAKAGWHVIAVLLAVILPARLGQSERLAVGAFACRSSAARSAV
jgi:hypothetical protein